ncbi:ganglioside GM2 activator-like isoform X2 [Uloborus diversus]|nr:ganglioside GM2 activator-like isoform X2 [Uloborus diversus]
MILHLTKLEPKRMTVPCLQNIGSCEYDVCEMIKNHQTEFCPMFPPHAQCGCPLKKAVYSLTDAPVAIPDFGEIFAKILQGGYEGNITFIDKSSGTEVGCIAITFQIEPSELL